MKWQKAKLMLGVVFLIGWPIYILTHFPFEANGYRVPSSDGKYSAEVMFISKSPTLSAHTRHYEVAVYRGGYPETSFGWLIRSIWEPSCFKAHVPVSAVGDGFQLTRDAIKWNIEQGVVTFALGQTNVTARLK